MKNWLKENRGFIIFLLCLGCFRGAIADWNPIPSGSMRPTLLEGDVVLVDRTAYDLKVPLTDVSVARLGDPKRGDVITFASPKDGTRLIKRLVAVPGDVVELRDEQLVINGEIAHYQPLAHVIEFAGGNITPGVRATERLAGSERAVQFLPRVPAMRNFGPVAVPPDHFFMLGDNRDDSADSRYIGFVPRALLIGRAHHVLASADILSNWLPRVGRFGQRIE